MNLDPGSHTPIYRQIVEGMRSSIAAGVYRPGEIIPSVRALAMDIQVNPNTVQRAYEELERQGVIESRRGVGKFVSSEGPESAVNRSELAVQDAFRRGMELARAAELPERRIRKLFSECLAESSKTARS